MEAGPGTDVEPNTGAEAMLGAGAFSRKKIAIKRLSPSEQSCERLFNSEHHQD